MIHEGFVIFRLFYIWVFSHDLRNKGPCYTKGIMQKYCFGELDANTFIPFLSQVRKYTVPTMCLFVKDKQLVKLKLSVFNNWPVKSS